MFLFLRLAVQRKPILLILYHDPFELNTVFCFPGKNYNSVDNFNLFFSKTVNQLLI